MFGNERYKTFYLLLRLEILARPKSCGKSLLYLGHFDIQGPHSTQISVKRPRIQFHLFVHVKYQIQQIKGIMTKN